VLATRVKRAHKLHGQKLIVADLREHEMARRANLFFRPKPGTDLVWLSTISRYLLDNGKAATSLLKEWTNGIEEYRKSLEPFTLEFASATCGVSIETLKQVTTMIAEAKASALSGPWA
jgi:formate dehydrogenase major subunit